MILNKLGKKSKGVKYFNIIQPGLGLTVKCIGLSGRIYTFNNVNVIEWMYQGREVNMSSNSHDSYTNPYSFSLHPSVTITKAEKIEREMLTISKE